MVGNLAPPSKLTVTTFDGKPAVEVPYARLPRIERLRVSGKIDETEDNSEDEEGVNGEEGKKLSKEEREKRKTRGKGKSLKRYLRKQRKNVIDPAAVCSHFLPFLFDIDPADISALGCHSCQAREAERREEEGCCCCGRKW